MTASQVLTADERQYLKSLVDRAQRAKVHAQDDRRPVARCNAYNLLNGLRCSYAAKVDGKCLVHARRG